MPENKRKRIDSIDAMRGLAVILMVIHHFFYDLVELCGAPEWLFSNPIFTPLHYFFAGLFIFLSGVSSNFSRSNVKRGVKCLAIALLMTFVTSLPIINAPIRFGVLHLLGVCMIFYGMVSDKLDKLPRVLRAAIYLVLLFAVSYILSGNHTIGDDTILGGASRYMYIFGWMYPGFYSSDYFPVFPWIFVFLLGTVAGAYIKEGRLPEKFYTFTCPVLPQVGRNALLIYVLHQPILYAVVYAYLFISSR